MSAKTKSTVKMLCVRSDAVMRKELPEEAQKLLDLYNDPCVSLEQKANVKIELDRAIEELENRVTTRRMNESRLAGAGPFVP